MLGSVNQEMLILARESRGWSQSRLADEIGRSSGLVSKIEHGILGATMPMVEDVAEKLRYPVSFFFRPEHVRGSDSICFHHRKRQSMPAKLLGTIEGQMHVTQLQVKSLLEDLDIETDYEFLTLDPDAYEGSPRRVAQVLRGLWQVPSGPIPDLVRVIEAAGGVVVFRRFETPKLDGMSCWAKGCPPLFFINSETPVDRARLTLAHELGHLVMHFSPPGGDPEVEANEFASEFLAPASELIPDLRNLRFAQLPGLKAKWRISMAALIMAAGRLNVLPQSRITSLWVQLSQAGYRKIEPFPLAAEFPTILGEAVRVHRDEHEYSNDELARLTDLLPEEFELLYGQRDTANKLLSVLS